MADFIARYESRHRRVHGPLRRETLRQLLGWNHSGIHLGAGEEPIGSHDVHGRERLAEYPLRAPLSLQKITWNNTTRQVIYRPGRSWHTKRNFQVFTSANFLAATVGHLPPKGRQSIRYYGLYSNRRRGIDTKAHRRHPRTRMPFIPHRLPWVPVPCVPSGANWSGGPGTPTPLNARAATAP